LIFRIKFKFVTTRIIYSARDYIITLIYFFKKNSSYAKIWIINMTYFRHMLVAFVGLIAGLEAGTIS